MSELVSRSKRILIIDDDQASCTFFEILLGKAGFETVSTFSGQAGLALLKKESSQTFGLVLLDLMMPGYDGYEVLEELTKQEYQNVPVFVVTARALDSQTVEKIKMLPQAVEIFSKPVDIIEFRKRVRELLNS